MKLHLKHFSFAAVLALSCVGAQISSTNPVFPGLVAPFSAQEGQKLLPSEWASDGIMVFPEAGRAP